MSDTTPSAPRPPRIRHEPRMSDAARRFTLLRNRWEMHLADGGYGVDMYTLECQLREQASHLIQYFAA